MWHCGAYGRDGLVLGALCFRAPMDERVCASKQECADTMAAERVRIWHRIRELAAEGDPTGVVLAAVFERPEQILAGPDDA